MDCYSALLQYIVTVDCYSGSRRELSNQIDTGKAFGYYHDFALEWRMRDLDS